MSPLTVLMLRVPAAPSRTARPFQFVAPVPVPTMLVEMSVPETFAPSSVTTSSWLLVPAELKWLPVTVASICTPGWTASVTTSAGRPAVPLIPPIATTFVTE